MGIAATLRELFKGHQPDDIARKLAEVEAEIITRTQLLADARESANSEGALAHLRGESPPDRTRIRQGEDALEELRELRLGLAATLEKVRAEHQEKRKAELYDLIDARRKLRFKLYRDLYATVLIAARQARILGAGVAISGLPPDMSVVIEQCGFTPDADIAGAEAELKALGEDLTSRYPHMGASFFLSNECSTAALAAVPSLERTIFKTISRASAEAEDLS